MSRHLRPAAAALLVLAAVPGMARSAASEGSTAHEVWLLDQSSSPGLTHGGTLYVYDGGELSRHPAAAQPERIDLGGATSARCLAETGAAPVRPHMVTFNRGQTHAIVSFVVSGHVVFFDAATRQPLRCVRTEPGAGGNRQAHAAWPTPDERYVLVANQNGKKLERIATDYTAGSFVQQPEATLDLATGTTPNGLPRQDPVLRPDNAPICPFVPPGGFPALVSLRGGGLFAVDPYATPMAIVAEYTADVVPRDGCGFTAARRWVFASTGGGNAANLDGWFVYRLPAQARRFAAANPPNTPAIEVLADDDREHRDAHGVVAAGRDGYVWFLDRAGNGVEVHRTGSGRHVTTIDVRSAASADPTPDLGAASPDGRVMYLSLRGPNPLSGDPHASTGTTPGVLVLDVLAGGRSGRIRGLSPITNVDAAGIERADTHGLAVRTLG